MSTMTVMPSRAHRPAALLILALAGLIAACNAGPGATTPPATQGPTPTPAGPTPSPSPTPAPTFGQGQIQHPTGANDIVLRMEQGGGFMPMNFSITQAPQFTLYGDGTVIFQQIDNRGAPFGTLGYLPWLVGHLDEEGIQALLAFAMGPGRLANAKDNYDNPMIADAGTHVFNLNAAGEEKVVNVYALGLEGQPGPDQADRAGFSQLAAVLNDFASQDGLGDVVAYEPEFYKVVLVEAFGNPVGAPIDWPWTDVDPDDFASGDEPGAIKILDAEHVAELMEVPNGGHIGIWVTDPDDKLVQLAVRPLLPDENPES